MLDILGVGDAIVDKIIAFDESDPVMQKILPVKGLFFVATREEHSYLREKPSLNLLSSKEVRMSTNANMILRLCRAMAMSTPIRTTASERVGQVHSQMESSTPVRTRGGMSVLSWDNWWISEPQRV